jgi:Protein of unknown function (DUF3179)
VRSLSTVALIAVLALGFLYLARSRHLFGPPVAHPVTVSGGTAATPLAAAIQGFKSDQIVSVLPRDAIPAIDNPRFVSANRARLVDSDRVIGVEIDGEAHAYPVGTLSSHEIVNDVIRGHPIAVTW